MSADIPEQIGVFGEDLESQGIAHNQLPAGFGRFRQVSVPEPQEVRTDPFAGGLAARCEKCGSSPIFSPQTTE